MLTFRGYCLGLDGHIVMGEDLQASDLSDAIEKTRLICEKIADSARDQIEVWDRQRLLYTTKQTVLHQTH
jgi:hypothetical protein